MTQRLASRRWLSTLNAHLRTEAPGLQPVFRACRDFDRLLHRLRLLRRGESLATRVSWWPTVAVLGDASPAKTAFLDCYRTTTDALPTDGAITALCYGSAAPDNDPRLPTGLDQPCRVEASKNERLRGLILLDIAEGTSPPAERAVECSDLVLVFNGAPPEAPASSPDKTFTVSSEAADLAGIEARMAVLGAEHGERVATLFDTLANRVENDVIPGLEAALKRWRRGVFFGAALWLVLLGLVFGGALFLAGTANLPAFVRWLFDQRPARWGGLPLRLLVLLVGAVGLWLAGHFWVRCWAANRVLPSLSEQGEPDRAGEGDFTLRRAFFKNTRFPRSAFGSGVSCWGGGAKRRLAAIRATMNKHKQSLATPGVAAKG